MAYQAKTIASANRDTDHDRDMQPNQAHLSEKCLDYSLNYPNGLAPMQLDILGFSWLIALNASRNATKWMSNSNNLC